MKACTIPSLRCDNRRLPIVRAIHDFLPRHQAKSEIYAFDLCRELATTDHVTLSALTFFHLAPPVRRRFEMVMDELLT